MAGPRGGYLVGLVGAGIGTSLSPPLHEREADELGIRYLYRLIDLDRLGLAARDAGQLVHHTRQLGFDGLNITYPCKRGVVEHLDELSAQAALLGAVNTVVFAGGRAIGHNTDWSGFAQGFRRGLPDAPLGTVVLLGAGGAGAAVAYAMLGLGAKRLVVVDTEPDRAHRLAHALGSAVPPGQSGAVPPGQSGAVPPEESVVVPPGPGQGGGYCPAILADSGSSLPGWLAEADGLVNATPVGMAAHPGTPVALDLLRPDMWVADIIYRPLCTTLLRHAEALGCRTLNGGGMVVFQAAEALHLFTGAQPDVDRMYRHFTTLVGPTHRDDGTGRCG